MFVAFLTLMYAPYLK